MDNKTRSAIKLERWYRLLNYNVEGNCQQGKERDLAYQFCYYSTIDNQDMKRGFSEARNPVMI
jgi:hypothetical protein